MPLDFRSSAAILCLAALAGCGPPGADPDAGPSVLIVCVDALRADRIGAYGYERPTTPHIDSLAADPDAVLFRSHYAQGAHTKASTASLFTGLFAYQHGINWEPEIVPAGDAQRFNIQVLDEAFETMAERMRAAGFRTFGVVKSHHLLAEYGYSQGFDEYFSAEQISGDEDRAEKTLELVRSGKRPFFGYLHLAGVHHPFPEESRDPEFMQRFGFEYDEEARRSAGIDFTTPATKRAINREGLALSTEDVRFLDLVYDAELRRVDERFVGRILEGLRSTGAYDRMLLVLTADHGEELYDHQGYGHGHALWDEVVRVPLIAKFPKGQKPVDLTSEVEAVTQAIDLIPSILSLVGGPAPTDLPGTDIFFGAPRGSAFSEIRRGYMLVQGDHKLIESRGLTFLSQRSTDPGERVNVADREPKRVAAMREAVEVLRAQTALGAHDAAVLEAELDDRTLEALRSLGYVD